MRESCVPQHLPDALILRHSVAIQLRVNSRFTFDPLQRKGVLHALNTWRKVILLVQGAEAGTFLSSPPCTQFSPSPALTLLYYSGSSNAIADADPNFVPRMSRRLAGQRPEVEVIRRSRHAPNPPPPSISSPFASIHYTAHVTANDEEYWEKHDDETLQQADDRIATFSAPSTTATGISHPIIVRSFRRCAIITILWDSNPTVRV